MIQKIWIGIVLYSFYYAQVTTAKVQTAKAQIFVDPSNNLTCPPSDYSELTIHASFFSQASMIIVYGGVIFNIAVYGVKSSFSSITTFLLDDISIFALSFTPIISWYFVAKPIYLRGHEQLDILIIFGTIFLILFLFITYLLILYNWPCHRGHYWKKQRRFFFTKKSLCWIKYIIVHTYLIHSILIIFYDIITSPTSYEKYHVKAFIDFQILNFFTDFVYFCLSSFLIFEFHHKKLVHKRVFFFTVFLSVIQILFEYALVCSPNYVDTIFTFFLTTILTRSLASFFSENKKTVKIYGTDVSLIYKKKKKNGKDKDETKLNELETSMEYNGIRLIFNYGNNVKKDLELYGAKITLTDESDESDVISNNNTTDEKILVNPVNITLVYENDEIKEPAELDITGKIIKFKVIDGFGFLNYIITNYNRQKQN